MPNTCPREGGAGARRCSTRPQRAVPNGALYDVMPTSKTPCPILGCPDMAPKAAPTLIAHFRAKHLVEPSVGLTQPRAQKVVTLTEVPGLRVRNRVQWRCAFEGCTFQGMRRRCERHVKDNEHHVATGEWMMGPRRLVRKTPVLRQRYDAWVAAGFARGPPGSEPQHITALNPDGVRVPLENVTSFKYLGRTLRADGFDRECVSERLALAAQTAQRIFAHRLKHASNKTRLRLYTAIVKSRVTYGSASWTLTLSDRNRLNSFHLRWLRRITGMVPRMVDGKLIFPRNRDVYAKADAIPLAHEVDVQRFRFYGHTLRRDNRVYGRIPLTTRQCISNKGLNQQCEVLRRLAGATDVEPNGEDGRKAWRGATARLRKHFADAARSAPHDTQ